MTDPSTADECARRREAFAATLERRGVGAAIVSSEANFAYLTGYLTPSWANTTRPIALVVATDRSCAAVLSAAEGDRLAETVPGIEVMPYLEPAIRRDEGHATADFTRAAVNAVIGRLRQLGIARVGAELAPVASPTLPGHLVVSACDELGAQSEDIAAALIAQRRRKSPSEVERLRAAGAALGAVFDRFASAAREGATERELAATIAGLAAQQGADRVGYAAVAASSSGALIGRPRDLEWRAGAILHVDVGLVLDGYWADFCRQLVCADPTPTAATAYERIVAAVRAGSESARAGVLASDVARAIAAELPSDGGLFGRFGHGVGLELTEPPSLHVADDTPLEPGMTLCIEPSAWFDGVGRLVGEEMVVVRDGPPELLSPPMPAELIRVQS